MAGSITVAAAAIGGNITRYTVAWVSDALGAVSGNSFPVEAGHLMQVRQIPDAAATQPTDQYDVTVLDANSFDVLVGGGANISNAGPTYITPVLTTGYPIFVEAGNLTPVVAHAGNAKGGQTVFYVSPGDSLRLGTAVTLDASDATQTTVASVSGATVTGNAAKFADTAGTVEDAGGTPCLLDVADQTISGGANVTALSLGTKSSGTLTIDCGARPLQYVTNGGAFTLAAPSAAGSCIVFVTNNALAGAITFSGFSAGSNTGDALTTTDTEEFSIFVWKVNGVSGYRVAAHQ